MNIGEKLDKIIELHQEQRTDIAVIKHKLSCNGEKLREIESAVDLNTAFRTGAKAVYLAFGTAITIIGIAIGYVSNK